MKTLSLVFLLSLGCQYLEGNGPLGIPIAGKGYDEPVLRRERQDEAEMIVWKWTYGSSATIVPPPPVVWISGAVCTGNDGKNYPDAFECNGGETGCCWGYFNWQGYVIYVAMRGTNISDTSYSHEMCHAWMWTEGLELDTDHSTHCFKAESGYQTTDTLVGEANRRLKVVGL